MFKDGLIFEKTIAIELKWIIYWVIIILIKFCEKKKRKIEIKLIKISEGIKKKINIK